jgi:hypothetical protein
VVSTRPAPATCSGPVSSSVPCSRKSAEDELAAISISPGSTTRAVFIAGLLFPPNVAAVPLFLQLQRIHLLDNQLGVALPEAAFQFFSPGCPSGVSPIVALANEPTGTESGDSR